MILKTKEFKSACKSILSAVDTSTHSIINESLELKVEGDTLFLYVTNKEYFVSVKLNVGAGEEFKATVDAKLFLSLMDKITTDELELSVEGNSLIINGNGRYKLSMFTSDDKLLELEPITIDNITSTFTMSSDILLSILNNNTNTLNTGVATRPTHNLFYLDDQGCITYRAGACINTFSLPQYVQLLLNLKLVKLFKLFPSGKDIKFTLGHDIANGVAQDKVRFESDNVDLTCILISDKAMIESVPASKIRERITKAYPYCVNINKDALIQAIDRLSLFTSSLNGTSKDIATFEFANDSLTIYAKDGENKEFIPYVKTIGDCDYKGHLNIIELKTILLGCSEPILTINFGDKQAFVVSRGNIKSVLPEAHLV